MWRRGGLIVRLPTDRAVWVRALAGDIVLCSWARHLTLTVKEYKWVPANCWGNQVNCRGVNLRWTSISSKGSRNTPSRFMLQKPWFSASRFKASLYYFYGLLFLYSNKESIKLTYNNSVVHFYKGHFFFSERKQRILCSSKALNFRIKRLIAMFLRYL